MSYKNLLSAISLFISLFPGAGSVSASIVLPQEASTGEDGALSISADMTLWSDLTISTILKAFISVPGRH